jgi:ABC-2 type transport system ATP-binding protein
MEKKKAIEVAVLTKVYDGLVAVDSISFEVHAGEVFGFLGPNGAGKTTTIRMLTGLSRPNAGRARVLGYDISSEIVKAKKSFGVVPEQSNMYDELTGQDNLVFMGQLYGVPSRERQPRAEELLKTFGLYERKDTKFATYSRGMKRALTIAAALVHRPRLLFLDEPTVGLDVVAARNLRALIQRLREDGITVFLTTHYLEEADILCDRIVLLVKGKIVAVDTPAKLKAMAEEKPALEVSFKMPLIKAADELGRRLPGLAVVKVDDRIRIYGGDADVVLHAILGYATENGTQVASVNSLKPSLEDAFIKLTGLSPLLMAAEKGGR